MLQINSKSKIILEPYTHKEIMQKKQSDLWNRAEAVASNLLNLQNIVVKMLPEAKKLLPRNLEELKEEEAQANFANYIRLRSFYAFAEAVWKVIEQQCRKLAEAEDNARGLIEDSKEALSKTLGVSETIPFEKLIDKNSFGLDELNELLLRFENNPSYLRVLHCWSFHDIIGSIAVSGFMHEGLLSSALSDDLPSDSSIGQLLADDKPIRFY